MTSVADDLPGRPAGRWRWPENAGDAFVLASILLADLHWHRQLPADWELVQSIQGPGSQAT